MIKEKGYNWDYVPVGGVVRVRFNTGEDIAHLAELDQKKWTVLSAPVDGLNMDPETLKMVDTDGDGKIRVAEVVAAAEWVTSMIKDKDAIIRGESVLPLDQFNTENEEGQRLQDSAKHILASLGMPDATEISLKESSDSVAIFAKTQFNGDGIVTPASADKEELKKAIADMVETVGGKTDRSGEQGVDKDAVEKFYAECADYSAWMAAGAADAANVFPYGDNTAAALDACNVLKDKVADYFMRCKLINFDEAVSGALGVSVDKISAIADKNLSVCPEDIATCPLARPSKDKLLPFDAINPAWQAAFAALQALVLDVDFKGKSSIGEDEWNSVLAKFGPYCAWLDAKKGVAAEPLGLEYVNTLLADGSKDAVLALIDKDASYKEEAESIDEVDKLLHLIRDFYCLLNNFVVFSDFYGRNGEPKAAFEAGKLFIDERCCNLCIRLHGPGDHAEAADLSGMFLIYCTCTSKKLGQTQNIVAVMTDGSIKNLRPGKNGVFYDLDGNDWDAVVTKIVDNPISIRQAFWSPYRKLSKFINDKIEKNAADKDAAVTANLLEKADNVSADGAKKPAFDIGKFAGIFAAISMAFAGIGVALKAIISGVAALKFWQVLLVIAVIMLIISLPACFLAWKKLRKRDLGPVLNANGWAVNSLVLVNTMFGKTLTNVAKYPLVKGKDPYKAKVPAWERWFCSIILVLAIAFGVLFFTNNLKFIGIDRTKAEEPVEQVEEVPAEAVAETVTEESAE